MNTGIAMMFGAAAGLLGGNLALWQFGLFDERPPAAAAASAQATPEAKLSTVSNDAREVSASMCELRVLMRELSVKAQCNTQLMGILLEQTRSLVDDKAKR